MADNNIKRTPDNALAVREPDAIAETKPAGLSTGAKVAVGAGITGAVGLAGFGLYKLGTRLGWWGQAHNTIVIDDADGIDGRDGANGKDGSSGGGSSGGGSTSRGRAVGTPPNISGDPQGYNTTRFESPAPVRLTLIFLGFKVESNDETLVPNNQPNGEVMRFQREWNRVIRGIDSGKVKFPAGMDDPLLKNLRGVLTEDGIPGKNTLNALEIASNTMFRHPLTLRWGQLVEMAA